MNHFFIIPVVKSKQQLGKLVNEKMRIWLDLTSTGLVVFARINDNCHNVYDFSRLPIYRLKKSGQDMIIGSNYGSSSNNLNFFD